MERFAVATWEFFEEIQYPLSFSTTTRKIPEQLREDAKEVLQKALQKKYRDDHLFQDLLVIWENTLYTQVKMLKSRYISVRLRGKEESHILKDNYPFGYLHVPIFYYFYEKEPLLKVIKAFHDGLTETLLGKDITMENLKKKLIKNLKANGWDPREHVRMHVEMVSRVTLNWMMRHPTLHEYKNLGEPQELDGYSYLLSLFGYKKNPLQPESLFSNTIKYLSILGWFTMSTSDDPENILQGPFDNRYLGSINRFLGYSTPPKNLKAILEVIVKPLFRFFAGKGKIEEFDTSRLLERELSITF